MPTPQQLKFTEPPMRGFLIHLTVYIVVMVGLAALNLIKNPTHLVCATLLPGHLRLHGRRRL